MLKESVQAQTHTQDDSICAKLIFGTNSIFWLDITLVERRPETSSFNFLMSVFYIQIIILNVGLVRSSK